MLADQLMCIKFVLWRKSIFSSTKAILTSLALRYLEYVISRVRANGVYFDYFLKNHCNAVELYGFSNINN